MDLKVDHPVCNDHGRYYVLAPELFQSGYHGYSVVTTEDVLRVPGKRRPQRTGDLSRTCDLIPLIAPKPCSA